MVVALLGGAATLAASEVPETRDEHFEPTRSIPEARTRAELRTTRATFERMGYDLLRTVATREHYAHVSEEVEVGQCITIIAGAWGRRRVREIVWLPHLVSAGRARDHLPRAEPYRRALVQHACPMRVSALGHRSFVRLDVWLDGPDGDGEILVMRGPPPSRTPAGTPLFDDRIVRIHRVWTPALSHTFLVVFAILLIGLMVESTVHTRRDRLDRERTLRRFTIALPSGVRGVLESIAHEGALDPAPARALRDQLAALAPLAHSAVLQRWRADQDVVDARREKLLAELAHRRVAAKHGGYRAADDGLFAITLVIRHRCELPELPARLDAIHLAYALESSLPRHDAELIDVEILWHPRERVEALDPTQLAQLFPELVELASGTTTTCAACEAPVAGAPARCPACGERYAPRAVDGRFEAAVAPS